MGRVLSHDEHDQLQIEELGKQRAQRKILNTVRLLRVFPRQFEKVTSEFFYIHFYKLKKYNPSHGNFKKVQPLPWNLKNSVTPPTESLTPRSGK